MNRVNWTEFSVEEFSREVAVIDKLLDTGLSERKLQESGHRLAALEDAIRLRGFYEELQTKLTAVQKK